MKNDYEIRGDVTAIFIKRKDGTLIETLISTSDLEKVKSFPHAWWSYFEESMKSYYVAGNLPKENGKIRKQIRLHRFILEAEKGLVVDHIDHDTLNNVRENLRVLTHAQNLQNRKGPMKSNRTGIRGVGWFKPTKKWRSRVAINGKTITLGYFEKKEDAEKAVIQARRKYMPYSINDLKEEHK